MKRDDRHDQVSRAYAEALQRSRTGGGCCSGSPVSVAARSAGYGEEAERYADAAASSFGCGNPLAFAGVQPGQTVLDLGSGAGLDLLAARDRVGAAGRVIGVDMTQEMIDAAREHVARAGFDNVELRLGTIESLPVDDGSVDWVISNCVINLATDKPAVFREIHRVLRRGGRFSISDIVVESLPDWIRTSAAAYSACVAGAISEREYVGGLRDAGFEEVEVSERLVYDESQLRAMIGTDLASFELDPALVDRGLAEIAGSVWSAKLGGRRPPG